MSLVGHEWGTLPSPRPNDDFEIAADGIKKRTLCLIVIPFQGNKV